MEQSWRAGWTLRISLDKFPPPFSFPLFLLRVHFLFLFRLNLFRFLFRILFSLPISLYPACLSVISFSIRAELYIFFRFASFILHHVRRFVSHRAVLSRAVPCRIVFIRRVLSCRDIPCRLRTLTSCDNSVSPDCVRPSDIAGRGRHRPAGPQHAARGRPAEVDGRTARTRRQHYRKLPRTGTPVSRTDIPRAKGHRRAPRDTTHTRTAGKRGTPRAQKNTADTKGIQPAHRATEGHRAREQRDTVSEVRDTAVTERHRARAALRRSEGDSCWDKRRDYETTFMPPINQ